MHALYGLPVPLSSTRASLREARPGLERGARARPRLLLILDFSLNFILPCRHAQPTTPTQAPHLASYSGEAYSECDMSRPSRYCCRKRTHSAGLHLKTSTEAATRLIY